MADQKYRPSGSPSQDHSLASLVGLGAAAGAAGAASSGEDSPERSPPKDERFAAYLERSGQQLAPPEPGEHCSKQGGAAQGGREGAATTGNQSTQSI